jgi:hypothetical protein
MAALLAFTLLPVHAAEPDLLEPERAFAFSARGLDPQTVEVRFDVAEALPRATTCIATSCGSPCSPGAWRRRLHCPPGA